MQRWSTLLVAVRSDRHRLSSGIERKIGLITEKRLARTPIGRARAIAADVPLSGMGAAFS